MNEVYQMVIKNVALNIRKRSTSLFQGSDSGLDAFTCSSILAIAFAKTKEDVLADLMRAEV